jgi:hypothetical protein
MKKLTLCLFIFVTAVLGLSDHQLILGDNIVQRNYGCPTGCICTLAGGICTPSTISAGPLGSCTCSGIGVSGSYTSCTVGGIAPPQTGVAPNGCTGINGGITCVDFRNNANYCGSCNNTCISGTCAPNGSGIGTCAPCTQTCNGVCINTATSTNNCGGCGMACPAGATCIGSVCTCPTGQLLCGGTCIHPLIDSNNCNTCGTVCPAGVNCVGGVCTCPTGQQLCPTTAGGPNQVCTSIDATQCTACGTPCTGSDTICVVSGSTGTCVAGGFTDVQCASANDSAIVGAEGSALNVTTSLTSINLVNSVDCYSYCASNVTSGYFFLSRDLSTTGTNWICSCYTGTIPNPIGSASSTCSCALTNASSATAAGACTSSGGGTCACTGVLNIGGTAYISCTSSGVACVDGYGLSTGDQTNGSIELYSIP